MKLQKNIWPIKVSQHLREYDLIEKETLRSDSQNLPVQGKRSSTHEKMIFERLNN